MSNYFIRKREEKLQRRRIRRDIAAKMATARFCFDVAKFYYDENNLPGVVYWEREYKQRREEASALATELRRSYAKKRS